MTIELERFPVQNNSNSFSRNIASFQASTLLAMAFVFTLVSPFFSYLGRGLWSTWTIFFLWLFLFPLQNSLSFTLFIRGYKKKSFALFMLILWLLVVLLNAGLGRGYTAWSHVMHTTTLCMVVIIQIAYSSLKPKAFKTIVFWTITIMGIEAARSIPILLSEPGIARMLMEKPNSDLVSKAFSSGVGDYNLYTANAIVFPFLLAVASNLEGLERIVLFLSSVAIGLAVLLSTFTGAATIMVFGTVLLVLLSYGKSLRKLIGGTVAMFFFVATFAVIVSFFGGTEPFNRVVLKNIRLYRGISEYGLMQGDETKRSYLFSLSLNTFLDNPATGIGPCTTMPNPALHTRVGGHSSWIDQLAEYGILGFGFFLAFAIAEALSISKYLFQYKDSIIIKASAISCFLYFIGGIVNPVLFVYSMIVFLYLFVLGSVNVAVIHRI